MNHFKEKLVCPYCGKENPIENYEDHKKTLTCNICNKISRVNVRKKTIILYKTYEYENNQTTKPKYCKEKDKPHCQHLRQSGEWIGETYSCFLYKEDNLKEEKEKIFPCNKCKKDKKKMIYQ